MLTLLFGILSLYYANLKSTDSNAALKSSLKFTYFQEHTLFAGNSDPHNNSIGALPVRHNLCWYYVEITFHYTTRSIAFMLHVNMILSWIEARYDHLTTILCTLFSDLSAASSAKRPRQSHHHPVSFDNDARQRSAGITVGPPSHVDHVSSGVVHRWIPPRDTSFCSSRSSDDTSGRPRPSPTSSTSSPLPTLLVTSQADNYYSLSSIQCRLENKELWDRFSELGTEMIITKSGRWVGDDVTIDCLF